MHSADSGNSGFYTGPAVKAVAADVEQLKLMPDAAKAPAKAPVPGMVAANGGFYTGPAVKAMNALTNFLHAATGTAPAPTAALPTGNNGEKLILNI